MARMANQTEIQALLSDWMQKVESSDHDVTDVVNLYADDALLIPTLQAHFYTKHQGDYRLHDYFDALKALPELQVTLQHLETRVMDGWAMNLGVYTFEYEELEKHRSRSARFSFIYKDKDTGYKILHHHSSFFPEG